MFNLREFVKSGLLKAIGVQADYWVMLTAANWYSKGVLKEEDMIEIQAKIDEKNTPGEEVEEVVEENSAEEAENVVENAEVVKEDTLEETNEENN